MGYTVRPAHAADQDAIWRMLFYAARMDEDGATDPLAAQANAFLHPYAAGWGAAGDIGVLAFADDMLIGAAWVRAAATIGHDAPGAYGDAELAVAVIPAYIGQGVGTQLLTVLLARTDAAGHVVYLSVRTTNPAVRLYERHGFVTCARLTNRVGTESLMMKRSIPR